MARGGSVTPREEEPGAADLALPSLCHMKAHGCADVPPLIHPHILQGLLLCPST